ncbi:unnamed protein product, partial [Sphagnum balticum]
WEDRYKIAVGICKALEYLHHGSPRRVIHRNVQPSTILISHDFQPKLSGFVLAKFSHQRPMDHVEAGVIGTFGYMAPEYARWGQLSDKCDVYSFGVILLELITGWRAIDTMRGEEATLTTGVFGTLLESIRDGVRPQLPDADYCPDYLSAFIEKCWATNAVERPQFPIICQLFVDYKARVLD